MIDTSENGESGLTLGQFTAWITECEEQPAWRAKADREMDYLDGNQLDSEVLRRQQEVGIPPAIEPLIGPTIDAVLGMEVKSRQDWRVIPDSDKAGDDVADALNYRLNQAERQAKADRACSDAYRTQISVGLGWVEVAREHDPFRFPYRCGEVHRNEIWWDFLARQPDLSDARYLIRRRWTDRKIAELMFPGQAELIRHAGNGWHGIDLGNLTMDGGTSTGLAMAWGEERGWSIEEMQWRDVQLQRVCLFEVWYRDWVRALVIKTPDGRVVEYDRLNDMHNQAIAAGVVRPQSAIIAKMQLAWHLGPHKLIDGPSPYRHNKFPYVPFWGKREDRTGKPFGLIRGMMYLQDEVNARIAKMQWGLASVRTIRTEGAVVGEDEQFRNEIARPDADIILNQEHMARAGATFKVERDFELNRQQYDRLIDAREGIKRTGGIYNSFMGQDGQAKSGVAISGLVEQSTQTLADINDNFRFARAEVGDILLSLIIEDMLGKQEEVIVPGAPLKDDRTIILNAPAQDPDTGLQYLDNDVERTKLKVVLNDVPSTPSFRAQQLSALSESFKSMPKEYQGIVLPHLLALMDMPNKEDILEAVKKATEQPTPEQIEQRIKETVDAELARRGILEAEAKIKLLEAQARKTDAEAVNSGVEGMFSATQAAQNIALQPAVAPLADTLLRSAGFQDADAAPIVPSIEGIPALPPATNTNPATPVNPPVPTNPAVGMNAGIEGGPA